MSKKLFEKGFEEGYGGNYGDIQYTFNGMGGQLFATVTFTRRNEDDDKCEITIIQDGLITKQFVGDNKYNPSVRRSATCIYLISDDCEMGFYEGVIKRIEVISHKGNTGVGFNTVGTDEYTYLFGEPFAAYEDY